MKFGYLRETKEIAEKCGIHSITGINRTGLEEYLEVIFPNVDDWAHDKCIPNTKSRKRPDYRSEQLKLIIEINGLPHYQNPDIILKDKERRLFYESLGYKVIEIPFFIQLTKTSVKTLFDVEVKEDLFDENIPSLFSIDRCTPAYLCPLGIKRMAQDFISFPEQYFVNLRSMKTENIFLTSVDLLEKCYSKYKNKPSK